LVQQSGADAVMTLRVRSPRDLGAGILFALIGLVGLVFTIGWLGSGYRIGTASRMGPGYFPVLLSGLLLTFGAIIAGRAFVVDGPAIERGSLRSATLILLCILLFGFFINGAGLAPTAVLVTVVAAFAIKDARPLETGALAVGLAGFSVLLFVTLLKQPLNVFFEGWMR
jgi:hypothetical protein